MSKKLSIKKEYFDEVTSTPHFVVKLEYESCSIDHDDIYFDHIDDLANELEALERQRTGKVFLNGGNRFNLTIEMAATGGVEYKFKAESDPSFPGKLVLEGYFHIDGEHSGSSINSFVKLIKQGDEFII